ncbi:bifunctional serine/threonine-protein kinase/ABC transporter substrate-binding protein [Streptomyces sp. NPDC051018]|uniref:bifunctional serine/threonine-protein kinase/ABC transporter substrate-binding protein n=1 Tax=Streptomyces sp. NPDC051018 TaxID=3365639 RepID=UPI003792A6B0
MARLGAGGMGVVYLGRTDSGELAAVKVTLADLADQPDFRARFRREVDAARRVSSPWAVPVTGADADAPEPWLATAFVPGPSLAEAVAAEGPLPASSVRVLGAAIAKALAAVHEAGLIHRDVKPGNVLLALDGPRLIDFGIARTAGETPITSTDVVVGTPGFLAPEQAEARGAEIGPPSDVFALGCLLAYSLTGRLPFGRGAMDALLYRTVHDDPDLDGVEEGLARLLNACLEKDPRRRPTAVEVADRLARPSAYEEQEHRPAHPARPDQAGQEAGPGDGSDGSHGSGPGHVSAPGHGSHPGDGTAASGKPPATAAPAGEPPAAGTDWLPPGVVRIIAERSARMLALPGIEPTLAEDPEQEKKPVRRRAFLLAASGGAVLVAGGGAALWAGLRDDDGRGGEPAAAPDRRRWMIGVQADLTGPQKEIGIEQERGARLAVDLFNAQKDKPFTLGLKTEDDAGDKTRAPAAARRIAAERGVFAVLGSTGDYTTEAVIPAYDEAQLALMTTSAGLNTLATAENNVFLRACPQHPIVAMQLAYYIHGKARSVRPGLLQDRDDDNYAWQYIALINSVLAKQYGLRPHPRVVPAGVDAYGPVIKEMVRAGIDAYVHCGPARSAAKAARALAEAGFTGPRFGGQQVLGSEFLRLAGDAAEGWIIGAPVVDPVAVPGAKAFSAAYRKRYGRAPGFYAGESFDCVNMMVRSFIKGSKGTRRPSRGELAAALRKAKYTGAMGSYLFKQDTGDLGGLGTYLYTVDGGRYRYLGSAPVEDPGRRKS